MQRRESTLTKRSELESINASLKELSNKIIEHHHSSFELQKKSNTLISDVILEEGLLKDTQWKVCLSSNNSIYLEFLYEADHISLQGIAKLIADSQYGAFQFPDNIDLHYDEAVVTLHFDDPGLVPPFIQKTGIVVDMASVTSKLHDLKRQVRALESISHSLSL